MDKATVPCKYCEAPTTMTGTKQCDNCWEVASRVRTMPAKVLKRILVSERKDAAVSISVTVV